METAMCRGPGEDAAEGGGVKVMRGDTRYSKLALNLARHCDVPPSLAEEIFKVKSCGGQTPLTVDRWRQQWWDELAARQSKRMRRVWRHGRAVAVVALALWAGATAQAEDRRRREHREHHNYIIERQEAGAVQGVPTSRLIIGRREIDIYPNGLMFEGNNVVGSKK